MSTDHAHMKLLFVCTGNICRSAAAELLTANKRSRGASLRVRSAGTHARQGRRIHAMTAAVVEPWGIDVSGFRSTPLDRQLVDGADLVLTMTTQHRQDVLALSPYRMRSIYTLREAAHLLEGTPEQSWAGAPADEVGEALSAALASARARRGRSRASLDIVDPIDGSPDLHQQVVHEIADALSVIIAALDSAHPQPPRDPHPPRRGPRNDETIRLPRLPPVPPMRPARRP
jgi:protein-tyrosine phosphatase